MPKALSEELVPKTSKVCDERESIDKCPYQILSKNIQQDVIFVQSIRYGLYRSVWALAGA